MRALIAAVVLASIATAASVGNTEDLLGWSLVPPTVKTLNKTAYIGTWYEVIQDKFTNDTFQNASYCATATYGIDATNPDHITVLNYEHYESVAGPVVTVPGYAYQPDAANYPGRLKVVLKGDGAVPFAAPYWILKTGPIVNGMYDYAIVSDNLRLTLFVLTRDVNRYYSMYESEVTAFLAEQGFKSFINKPVKIVQKGCTYNRQPEKAVAAAQPAQRDNHKRENVGWSLVPKTVKDLNKTAYIGTWYEVIQDKFTNDTFQNASYCATATYGVDPTNPDRITVRNFEHFESVTGPVVTVTGYAYQPDAANYPGRLKVVLHGDGAKGAGFAAPYWIFKTGPIVNGMYDYAIVSDEFRLSLFVLTRDVNRFKTTYESEVTAFLAEQGFKTFINKPVKVVQDGCTYN